MLKKSESLTSVQLLGFLCTVEKNSLHFEVLLLLLSLRYDADLGRLGLVIIVTEVRKNSNGLQDAILLRKYLKTKKQTRKLTLFG